MGEPMFDEGPETSSAEIALDGRLATLERNPYFVCLGFRDDHYCFESKITHQRVETKNFSTEQILTLAPHGFWQTWSVVQVGVLNGDSRARIISALIMLAQKIGKVSAR